MSALTILFIFVPILVAILLLLNVLLAAHRPDSEKVTSYECGFQPIVGQTRAPFNIQYYLVGMLFMIFDIEILLFYPIATTLYQVSTYGFWVAVMFFTVLTLGFVYELGKGALYFTDQRSAITTNSLERPSSST
jgi:NADH:ubiquinone oxidoreductase subunit 3 (subunit A)